MTEEQLQRLLLIKGPAFPPVAHALSLLPDGHPLKPAAAEVVEPTVPVATKIEELEARVIALEESTGLNRQD